MLQKFSLVSRNFFFCNLLLVGCCGFYLAWWLLAFRPKNPVRGMQSGWLLLFACAAGCAGAFFAAKGFGAATVCPGPVLGSGILWGGAASYLLLAVITTVCLRRPLTTELFLIVGWAMLVLAELNALTGCGAFSRLPALLFAALAATGAVVSLACYLLYYRLPPEAGFWDGMVPLAVAALIMAGIDLALLVAAR